MKKPIGKVSEVEMLEIKRLYERKNGLLELFKALPDLEPEKEENNKLYEKIVQDISTTKAKYQKWFEDMSKKYGWEDKSGFNWQINFDTCEVFLVQ
jgi:CXXX repeat modification system protein